MQEYIYLIKLVGIVASASILTLVEKIIFHRLYPKVKESPRIWNEALLFALHFPLRVAVWLTALVLSAIVLEQTFINIEFFSHFWSEHFYKIVLFFIFTWAFLRFINKFESLYCTNKNGKGDPTKAQGISHFLKFVIFVFSGLEILQFLGIPLSGILAFGGFGGLAVGFAAKDLLANIFGGLMIFFDRQFQIGDWIRSPDKEIEGTVEHIGWRITQIRTPDKRPLFIPNSLFSTIALENPSRMSNRRIQATVGLSYEDAPKIAAILFDIEKMIKCHPEIDTTNICFVNLVDFGPHSLEVLICAFTKATDVIKFHAVQQDIFLNVLNVIHSHNSKIAYPVRSIHLPESTPASFFSKEMGVPI
jgi:MscS family membrane protein